ncbi:hypothetical protein HV819_05815 [Anaerococcus sp. AGMB00486]|uniref:Uncharacterized protein n=2 Tax=Anaerococcus TaxID=165779 RepID=A0ABX2N9Y7_9FIRM|nr:MULTISPECIES: hypothetical protein [Anaerococcus]MSS77644.1 hypothetical protein [Anaerococcus porci]NVF11498.1 hypothetical protein [Anaerococcus faecalis]
MDFIWPIFTALFVIFMLNFILDRRKVNLYLSLFMAVLSLGYGFVFGLNFKEIYFFSFLLSIGLIIISLRKEIESFTVIAIALMLVMLAILFKYPLL